MHIRYENRCDYQAIAELYRLAFERESEASLVESIRITERYIPELALVAELDGAVVGHILFSYIDILGQDEWQVLGLAPLAVQPEFQRRGIGSTLVRVGLEAASKGRIVGDCTGSSTVLLTLWLRVFSWLWNLFTLPSTRVELHGQTPQELSGTVQGEGDLSTSFQWSVTCQL